MSRNSMADPCRIDSDSDDDPPMPMPKRYQITQRPATPQTYRQPKKPDWDIQIEDEQEFAQKLPRRPVTSARDREPTQSKATSRQTSERVSSSSSSSSLSPAQPERTINQIPESPPASPSSNELSNYDPFALIQEDLIKFIHSHMPREYNGFIQCRLRRDSSGVQGNFCPTFFLQAERPADGRKHLLLAARRVAKVNRQAEYIITTNVETISEGVNGEGYVGKLRGNNLSGTEYTLYDDGLSPNKHTPSKSGYDRSKLRRELAVIVYNANLFGMKGPRQMNVMIPELGQFFQPAANEPTMLSQWRNRRLSYFIPLRNKSPVYNEITKTYVIQFVGNRVVKPSVKNFQILMETENHEEEVVMQFGKVDKDVFTCDYRYPLSAIQAFAIALSSFDSRLVRE